MIVAERNERGQSVSIFVLMIIGAFWVIISGIVELIGATLIVTNRYPRLGGWLIALFLVPVTITVHGVAMTTAPDAQMRAIQISFFLKGVAMTGAALLITQLGVRRVQPVTGDARMY